MTVPCVELGGAPARSISFVCLPARFPPRGGLCVESYSYFYPRWLPPCFLALSVEVLEDRRAVKGQWHVMKSADSGLKAPGFES